MNAVTSQMLQDAAVRDQRLAERDAAMAERDAAMAERDAALAEKLAGLVISGQQNQQSLHIGGWKTGQSRTTGARNSATR